MRLATLVYDVLGTILDSTTAYYVRNRTSIVTMLDFIQYAAVCTDFHNASIPNIPHTSVEI